MSVFNRRLPGRLVVYILLLNVIGLIDFLGSSRKRIRRRILRPTIALLTLTLIAVELANIVALIGVKNGTKSFTGDALVGIEASMAMRETTQSIYGDIVNIELHGGSLSKAVLADFEFRFEKQLLSYRSGAFDDEDKANSQRIAVAFDQYDNALHKLMITSPVDGNTIESAELAGHNLLEVIGTGYKYNQARLHVSGATTRRAAEKALALSKRIFWAFIIGAAIIIAIYRSYRWLLPIAGGEDL